MNAMTTILDTVVFFIPQFGRDEAIYLSLAFMKLTFGIIQKCMYPLMYHIYVLQN